MKAIAMMSAPRAVEIAGSGLPAPVLVYDGAWVLHEDYSYYDAPRDCLLNIPAGFRFDLASVPRALWWLIAPFELSIVAPLLHDWLYRHGGVVPGRSYTRAEADALFRDVMREEGVPGWRWRAAYLAVRVAGRGSWRAPPVNPIPQETAS